MRRAGRRTKAALVAAAVTAAAAAPAAAQSFVNTGDGVFAAPVTSLRDMPFRTTVRQQYDYSCGSAALATLLRYHYGRPVDEAQVFKAMYAVGDQPMIRKVGFSLLDMKTYLSSIGLASDGYRTTPRALAGSTAPAIAVVSIGAYRHFVVVKGVADGAVLVGDPALGLKTYPIAAFAKIWTGVLFRITPAAQAEFNREDEWGSLPHAPGAPMDDGSLAQFTRGLPPIYQISMMGVAP